MNKIMALNIITAQEACRIAKEASRMENIMRSIHSAAENGEFSTTVLIYSKKDIDRLRDLDYGVVPQDGFVDYYIVSWDESDSQH